MSSNLLHTIILAVFASGADLGLSKPRIAAIKKKTGNDFILLDELSPHVEAHIKQQNEIGARFNTHLANVINPEIVELKARIAELERENGNLKAEIDHRSDEAADSDEARVRLSERADDWEFVLPYSYMEAIKQAFDSTGEVKIRIHRTTSAARVVIEDGKPLDVLPVNSTLGNTEQPATFNSPVLTEEEYNRVAKGEDMDAVIAERKAEPQGQDEDEKADFGAIGRETGEIAAVNGALLLPKDAPAASPRASFAILSPTNREYGYATVQSILGNWKSTLAPEDRDKLASLDIEHDTVPHHARNILASRFLASGRDWSFWMDSDMIAQNGNAGWFKRKTGFKHSDDWIKESALLRLTSHAGKKFVSACYTERAPRARLMASAGMSPNGGEDEITNGIFKSGPKNQLRPVSWVGFGCVAVHRDVFIDILDKVPGVRAADGKAHGFFTAFEGGPTGEDIAFCKRASMAGHSIMLDMSVYAGHVGKFCFIN